MRLDLALIAQKPGLSRRKAREVIEKGQVCVEGQTVREAGHPVAPHAVISWDPNRKALPRLRCSLPVLYADDSLLVVDKPAGLLTVPTHPRVQDEDTALARVSEYARHQNPKRPYVGVVHRIDRDTSGAVAFALDPRTREALRALFRSHRIERRYAALVAGTPRSEEGLVDAPIHDIYQGGRRRVARAGEASREALTRYVVVERYAGATLLEITLGTGRQHQIRLHLAHVGLPILGDAVYRPAHAPREPIRAGRQMLHARVLGFVHPWTGREMRVESPLPEDFRRVLAALLRRRA